ncbi:hypothetical protein SHL15_7807 [Streptomyces hygroscopicus subsp. limoneus]|nr:hypothetical protein SHL15_7807 [Streptomyces hygroscopicus subsp. limoneus]
MTEAIDPLTVAAEGRTGYDRQEAVGDWIDADCDGCTTRIISWDDDLQALGAG